MQKEDLYELVIIGAGPAGLSASVYASRFGIKHIVFGGLAGGIVSEAHLVDNYLGIEDISGFDLSQKFLKHAKKYGTEIIPGIVKEVKRVEKNLFEVIFSDKKILTKTILLAAGTKRKKLGIKGEDTFFGKGVSYCATCDGFFYKNKVVGVVGGGNSAVSAAVYLADIAQKVYLINKTKNFLAEEYWIKLAKKNEKIAIFQNSKIKEIFGEKRVEGVILENELQKKEEKIMLNGIFIECGSDPNMDFGDILGAEKDEMGFIKISSGGETSATGVWAAGDITNGSNKFFQVITAAAEGAIAAKSIYNYLRKTS
jgi:thioredoxin reductase (NADPH)